jgi:hypothetical protein
MPWFEQDLRHTAWISENPPWMARSEGNALRQTFRAPLRVVHSHLETGVSWRSGVRLEGTSLTYKPELVAHCCAAIPLRQVVAAP